MLKITIKEKQAITANLDIQGKKFEVTSQWGWVHLPDGEVRKVQVPLEKGASGFEPGDYIMGAESFLIDEYHRMRIAYTWKLEPLRPVSAPQQRVG